MRGVITSRGELKTATRKTGEPTPVVYDPVTAKFVRGYLMTDENGVVTWAFEEAPPPLTYVDPITRNTYAPVLTTEGGVVAWSFTQVT